jgi:hypothetical protein
MFTNDQLSTIKEALSVAINDSIANAENFDEVRRILLDGGYVEFFRRGEDGAKLAGRLAKEERDRYTKYMDVLLSIRETEIQIAADTVINALS